MGVAQAIKAWFAKSFSPSDPVSGTEGGWFAATWPLSSLAILFVGTQIMIALFEDHQEAAPYRVFLVVLVPWLLAALPLVWLMKPRLRAAGVSPPVAAVPLLSLYPVIMFLISALVTGAGLRPGVQAWAVPLAIVWLFFSIFFLLWILCRPLHKSPTPPSP
ncbi:hypothetical protein [Neotabrizicola sp. sgz301269]|uniref:hypothetical protein n=1 Tax=Neotabrizicola sp. sgz301269 TaxID=3276282 RepID=UPI003770186B